MNYYLVKFKDGPGFEKNWTEVHAGGRNIEVCAVHYLNKTITVLTDNTTIKEVRELPLVKKAYKLYY